MIVVKELPKSHPKYKTGLRYTMNVNDFVTFFMTYNSAKELRDDLTKMLGRVKE